MDQYLNTYKFCSSVPATSGSSKTVTSKVPFLLLKHQNTLNHKSFMFLHSTIARVLVNGPEHLQYKFRPIVETGASHMGHDIKVMNSCDSHCSF